MKDINFTAGREGINFSSAVEAMIKKSCIIDYGIVQEVVAKGVVKVALSVAKTEQDIVCLTCVLANVASSSLTIDVTPNVGDKVLVFYPRYYHDKMFNVSEDEKEKTKILVSSQAGGYSLMSGIAILINQYKSKGHKNYINFTDGRIDGHLAFSKEDDKELNLLNFATAEDGSITLDIGDIEDGDNFLQTELNAEGSCKVNNKSNSLQMNSDGTINVALAYDEDKDKNLLNINTQTDGSVAVDVGDTSGDAYCKMQINADGSYSVENKKGSTSLDKDGLLSIKSNNVNISTNSNSEITVNNGKAEIKVDQNGNVSIDAKTGKITLKNNMANLFTILNGMLQILNTSLATAGSPASHTVVPQQFTQQSTQLGQLMQ